MIWTSAGATASIDLCIALVEEDLGPVGALNITQSLMLFMKRPGTQSQLSAPLEAQMKAAAARPDERFIALHAWLSSRLSEKIGVEELARFVGMSARSFYRAYTAKTGTTPAKAIETLRLEAARRDLAGSTISMKRIATTCGFGSEERMRRAFLRSYGVCPSEYRVRCRPHMQSIAS